MRFAPSPQIDLTDAESLFADDAIWTGRPMRSVGGISLFDMVAVAAARYDAIEFGVRVHERME
jgi:hypothetical protein